MSKVSLAVFLLIFSVGMILSQQMANAAGAADKAPVYQYGETRNLVSLVNEAAAAVEKHGEASFVQFKKEGSKWRRGDTYIFVLDTYGHMIVHPDPALEGKDEIDLKDVNGKPIIKGLIDASVGDKKQGWFHYQWPEPGKLFPVWKSSFVRLAPAPSGRQYIVGSGLYNMKIEKEFIVALVNSAAELIEKEGRDAFPALRDKAGPFMFMDIYVFVDNAAGEELVNGAFPNIEGRNLMDYKDSKGRYIVREYIDIALHKGSGWLYYYWPKPGQSDPSKKHTYVRKVKYGDETFIVGSGAYLG